MKAVHYARGQEVWSHVVREMLEDLGTPSDLIERGRVLDNDYIPTRYPNGHAQERHSNTTDRCKARMQSVMPVRSLNSRIFKWPKRDDVDAAVGEWASRQREIHPELLRLGYFGSMGHGTWGFGSDIDIVIIVRESSRPAIERPIDWNTRGIPVDADLLIYTEEEFQRIMSDDSRFAGEMRAVRWL